MADFQQLKIMLERNNQEHLLRFLDTFSSEQKRLFLQYLNGLNFDNFSRVYKRGMKIDRRVKKYDDEMVPLPAKRYASVENSSAARLQRYFDIGLKEISKGAVAVLTVADTQGLEIGAQQLEGMKKLDILSKKSLFQLSAERIQQVQKLANEKHNASGTICWLIATTSVTVTEIKKYFSENYYFGLNTENIIFLDQGMLPCFQFDGKILLKTSNKLAMAPDGSGGIFTALKTTNMFKEFEKRGIKHLHVYNIKNILVKVADPVFLGYYVEKDAECAMKVVEKGTREEGIGLVCNIQHQTVVIESEQCTEETANLTHEDGSYVYTIGDVSNYMFSFEFLKYAAEQRIQIYVMPKRISYVDNDGNIINPTEANGVVLEKRAYDILSWASRVVVWDVPRVTEYSIVSGASLDEDWLAFAKVDLYKAHRQYLEAVNVIVIGDEVEISPLVSYAGEGLEKFEGQTVHCPLYVSLQKAYTGSVEKPKLKPIQEEDERSNVGQTDEGRSVVEGLPVTDDALSTIEGTEPPPLVGGVESSSDLAEEHRTYQEQGDQPFLGESSRSWRTVEARTGAGEQMGEQMAGNNSEDDVSSLEDDSL